MDITVIGLGARTGTDDRIGLDLVELLSSESRSQRTTYELWDGMDSAEMVSRLLETPNPIVVVDAADMGAQPGEYRFFDDKTAVFHIKTSSVSTHGMGLAEGLALSRDLGFDRPVKIFAVQPFDLSPSLSLTPQMLHRIPELAIALKRELAAMGAVP